MNNSMNNYKNYDGYDSYPEDDELKADRDLEDARDVLEEMNKGKEV